MDWTEKKLIDFNLPYVKGDVALIILVSLFVILLSAVCLRVTRKSVKKNTVVILGECEAGKTILFLQLVFGRLLPTHTSMKEGESFYQPDKSKSKKVLVKDFPGHQRLRYKLESQLAQAAAVVFVVDSVNFNPRLVAEYLYDVLTSKHVKDKVPILMFCNKMDIATALTPKSVQASLEKELDTLRKTRQAMPRAVGKEADDEEIYLGVEGSRFTFDQIQTDIIFAEGSAKTNDISAVQDFIAQNVK